jgi:hypothetical protein
MRIDFPFHIDTRGRTALTDHEDHIRDLIEQVLFTAQGERVNRPDFGCGLQQLVFAGNSEELASATQMLVQGALQQWLAEVMQVEEVRVTEEDALLTITIRYRVHRTGEQQIAMFRQEL